MPGRLGGVRVVEPKLRGTTIHSAQHEMSNFDVQWHHRIGSDYLTYEDLYRAFVKRYEEEKRSESERLLEDLDPEI